MLNVRGFRPHTPNALLARRHLLHFAAISPETASFWRIAMLHLCRQIPSLRKTYMTQDDLIFFRRIATISEDALLACASTLSVNEDFESLRHVVAVLHEDPTQEMFAHDRGCHLNGSTKLGRKGPKGPATFDAVFASALGSRAQDGSTARAQWSQSQFHLFVDVAALLRTRGRLNESFLVEGAARVQDPRFFRAILSESDANAVKAFEAAFINLNTVGTLAIFEALGPRGARGCAEALWEKILNQGAFTADGESTLAYLSSRMKTFIDGSADQRRGLFDLLDACETLMPGNASAELRAVVAIAYLQCAPIVDPEVVRRMAGKAPANYCVHPWTAMAQTASAEREAAYGTGRRSTHLDQTLLKWACASHCSSVIDLCEPTVRATQDASALVAYALQHRPGHLVEQPRLEHAIRALQNCGVNLEAVTIGAHNAVGRPSALGVLAAMAHHDGFEKKLAALLAAGCDPVAGLARGRRSPLTLRRALGEVEADRWEIYIRSHIARAAAGEALAAAVSHPALGSTR